MTQLFSFHLSSFMILPHFVCARAVPCIPGLIAFAAAFARASDDRWLHRFAGGLDGWPACIHLVEDELLAVNETGVRENSVCTLQPSPNPFDAGTFRNFPLQLESTARFLPSQSCPMPRRVHLHDHPGPRIA